MTYTRRTGGRHRHGHLAGGRRPPEYAIWAMMPQRCYNPRCREFGSYGGRGVGVCDRWRAAGGFTNFLADLGRQPRPGAGLRRLGERGNFEPGNVEWAETRTRHILSHDGRSMALTDWAKELSVKPGTLQARLHNGWPVEKVLTRGVDRRRPFATWDRQSPERNDGDERPGS